MPQMPIHYYDCRACKTCWKFGTKLLPDPIRQISEGLNARYQQSQVDLGQQLRFSVVIGLFR